MKNVARRKKGRERRMERERERKERSASWFFSRSALRVVKRGGGGGRNCQAENNFHERWRVGELRPITRTRNTRGERGNKKFSLSRDNAIKRQRHLLCPNLHEGAGLEGVGGAVYATPAELEDEGRVGENSPRAKMEGSLIMFLGWRACLGSNFPTPPPPNYRNSQIFTLHIPPFFSSSLFLFPFDLRPRCRTSPGCLIDRDKVSCEVNDLFHGI